MEQTTIAVTLAMVMLVAGFALGLMFANDHITDRFVSSIDKHAVLLDGKLVHVVPDSLYSDFLIADSFYKRELARRRQPLAAHDYQPRGL